MKLIWSFVEWWNNMGTFTENAVCERAIANIASHAHTSTIYAPGPWEVEPIVRRRIFNGVGCIKTTDRLWSTGIFYLFSENDALSIIVILIYLLQHALSAKTDHIPDEFHSQLSFEPVEDKLRRDRVSRREKFCSAWTLELCFFGYYVTRYSYSRNPRIRRVLLGRRADTPCIKSECYAHFGVLRTNEWWAYPAVGIWQ